MKFINLLIAGTLAAASIVRLAAAAAIRSSQAQASGETVTCDPVDKYTIEWFLENVLPEFQNSLVDKALFYSRGVTAFARKFAKNNDYITIWDVWACSLYIHHDKPDNPMRCIHNDPGQRTTFYENMSRAFATKASRSALVMHSFSDYENPPWTGIWGRIELPTIKSSTDVDLVAKVNQDATLCEVFWKRFRDSVGRHLSWLGSQSLQNSKVDLKSRETAASGACMAPEEYSFFDSVDW